MLNWGVAGSDLIAEDFIDTLLFRNRNCTLITDDIHLKTKYPQLPCFDILEDVLKYKGVDVIYISTFVYEHQDIIMKALKHGVHVIGEKPMFLNEEDANIAYQYARENNLILAEANTLFYMPIYLDIKKRIHNKEIGDLKIIRCEFGSLKEEDQNLQVMQKEKGGGALYDIGIYALSAVLQFLDTPTEVKSCNIQHDFGVDESWNINLKNKRNQIASIMCSIRCKLDKRLLIAGDKGFIEVFNYPRANSYDIVSPDMKRATITLGDTEDALLYEIEKMEEMIEKKSDNSNIVLTCEVMRVMDELRKEIQQ